MQVGGGGGGLKYALLSIGLFCCKDTLSGEIFYPTCLQLLVLSTVKVQIKPVSQLNHKEDPNKVLSLFLRYVDNKTTEKDEDIIELFGYCKGSTS